MGSAIMGAAATGATTADTAASVAPLDAWSLAPVRLSESKLAFLLRFLKHIL